MEVPTRRCILALLISVLAIAGAGLANAPAGAKTVGIDDGAYVLVVRTPSLTGDQVTRDPVRIRGNVFTLTSGRTTVRYPINGLRNGGQVDPHWAVRWVFHQSKNGWYSGPQWSAGIRLGRVTLIPTPAIRFRLTASWPP